jgi:hypothetical protein
MKAYLAIVLGLALLLAPLWSLSGFVTAPEFRSGTLADYSFALTVGFTLYGGVFMGVLLGRRYKFPGNFPVPFRRTFIAGVAGAMSAITLALAAGLLSELAATGRLIPDGQTPALLPVFYVVGGILCAFIAAGVGFISYGLGGAAKGNEPD